MPAAWSTETGENIAWRLPLPGPAGASPVVWGDKIFLTSAEGSDLALICVNTAGKELWKKQSVSGGNRMARGRDENAEGNSASPSPSTDGKHVWTMMGTGHLACYDFSGKEIWKLDLQERYGKFQIQFGMTSTPVLDGDRLYLQLIHSGGGRVIALDKANGNEVWAVKRESDARAECEHSYASPIMYRDNERAYLITHGADYAIAHDLADGRELWRCGGLNGGRRGYNNTLRFVASPVAVPGLIVVPTAKNGPVVAIDPKSGGNVTETPLWIFPSNTPDVPSPTVHDGIVYLAREQGTLITLDAKTGEKLYEERIHSSDHRASPLFADGKLYMSARDGTVNVIKGGRNFEKLAKNSFGEALTASPAVSEGTIYFRTFKALYAVRQK